MYDGKRSDSRLEGLTMCIKRRLGFVLIVQRYKTGGDWLPDLCPSYITKVGHLFLFLSHQRPFDTQNTFHLQFDEYRYILVCPVDQDTGCNEDSHLFF